MHKTGGGPTTELPPAASEGAVGDAIFFRREPGLRVGPEATRNGNKSREASEKEDSEGIKESRQKGAAPLTVEKFLRGALSGDARSGNGFDGSCVRCCVSGA